MGVNVGQVLRQAARLWPASEGLVDVGAPGAGERRVSYGALDRAACVAAARLHASGVADGQPVALIAGNGDAFVSAWFGVVYAGSPVVPIPVMSAPAEIAHRIEHAGCGAVVFDDERRELVTQALSRVGGQVPALPLSALAEGDDAIAHPADTAPGDTAMILYTSGTTGQAKGAAISHASLLTHTLALAHHTLRLSADDRVLGVLPLTHSYGCRMVMLASFFVGARCVLVPRFEASRTLSLMADHGVTWVPAVPTMYAAWAADAGGERPAALRWGLSAGAPLPDEVARRAERRLGCEVRQGYGMTEATFCTVNAPPDARVVGSVGQPVWGIEVRIVGEDGVDVPRGASGEVWVRGHNVMTHYLHDPAATEQVAAGGWMRSGDVGALDAEGRLSIVDRIKDLIIRGGHNVYPSEVEAALAEHPDVVEVAVVGRPDDYYGEEVVAVVVRRDGSSLDAQALSAFARERVARTKVPREVSFVDAMPLGPSGKVLKRELRDRLSRGELEAVAVGARPQTR